jgi:hypothetical protein
MKVFLSHSRKDKQFVQVPSPARLKRRISNRGLRGRYRIGRQFVAKIEEGPARCRNCLRVKHRIDARTDPEKGRQETTGASGLPVRLQINWRRLDTQGIRGPGRVEDTNGLLNGQGSPLTDVGPSLLGFLHPVSSFSQNLDPGRLLATVSGILVLACLPAIGVAVNRCICVPLWRMSRISAYLCTRLSGYLLPCLAVALLYCIPLIPLYRLPVSMSIGCYVIRIFALAFLPIFR